MTYEPPVTDYDYIVENCTCAFCGCNCDDLDYLVKNGHVVAVRHACRLGASKIMEDMDQRLIVPMIRDENGELKEVTKAPRTYAEVHYPDNCFLVFGKETAGLPETLLQEHPEDCVRIPMRDSLRSLNLSNCAAIAAYEVLRQWDFPNLVEQGQPTTFHW